MSDPGPGLWVLSIESRPGSTAWVFAFWNWDIKMSEGPRNVMCFSIDVSGSRLSQDILGEIRFRVARVGQFRV